MEPLVLKPVGKDYLWGGNRLKTEYGKNIDLTPLTESWECSVPPDGLSVIATGSKRSLTLKGILDEHPEYLGSKANGIMPILVKFIDTEQNLSVQVHPDDEYALTHEDDNGKTGMWYVLDALPGVSLIYGFAHDVTKELLQTSLEQGDFRKHLQKIPIHKGDIFYIPAGLVRAIGAGALIAEIQESSNVTYRVYDYGRIGKDGKPRELHIEKALDVMQMRASPPVRQQMRVIRYCPGCSREVLCRCRYFETERIQISMAISFSVNEASFQVLLCLDGRGGIETDHSPKPLRFKKGDCIFLPAGIGRYHIVGELELLKIRC